MKLKKGDRVKILEHEFPRYIGKIGTVTGFHVGKPVVKIRVWEHLETLPGKVEFLIRPPSP